MAKDDEEPAAEEDAAEALDDADEEERVEPRLAEAVASVVGTEV